MRVLFILSFIACLIEAFPFQFQGLRSNDLTSLLFTPDQDSLKDRLIKLGPDDYKLVSENEKLKLKREGINFIDVTNQIPIPVDFAVEEGIITKPNPPASFLQELLLMGAKQLEFLKKPVPVYKFPKEVKYNEEVSKLFKGIDTDLMLKNLGKFSSFFTRYYKSQYGVDSADWLFDEISSIIKPVNDKVNITKIRHNGWDQYSIIVSIPGKVTDKVVIGAHQDSMNLLFPNLLKAPGADDDGSGTVTTLEALRLIIGDYSTDKFVPYNTLEFHWYSAEEGGLLGSIDVFSQYSARKEVVVGMLQQDMTGYTAGTKKEGVEPHFGLITDYTSVELNNFLKLLINTYNSIPYQESSCGYACSDHASALENGYPSAFLIESEMKYTNKYIHSIMDTLDRLDWDHIKEHVKLTVAFAYELTLATELH